MKELDALAASYVAWMLVNKPEQLSLTGDQHEAGVLARER